MKVQKNIVQLSLLFIVVSFCSCKKDSGPPQANGTVLDRLEMTQSTSASVSTLHYSYNASGDLISIAAGSGADTLIYESPGRLTEYRAGNVYKSQMVYDANGRIIKKTGISQNIPFTTSVYTYDANGRVIADSTLDDTSRVYEYHVYTYDNDDNLISYQHYYRYNSDIYLTDGLVTVTFDHHPNPFAKFGKWVYYADGDFRFLFKENSVSEMSGGVELKNPADLVYSYYSNGLVWKTTSVSSQTTTVYYYK